MLLYVVLGIVWLFLMLRYSRRGLELEHEVPDAPTTRRLGAARAGPDVLRWRDESRRSSGSSSSRSSGPGFFVLEGFDLGVGVLHRWVGRTDVERRVAINTIGPVWDGNEVWLIVGGRRDLRRLPQLVRHLVLGGLPRAAAPPRRADHPRRLVRVARRRCAGPRGEGVWSWTLTIGSVLIPVLIGVALGDLLVGLPIDANEEFTGNFFDLLTPYGLWLGVTLLVLCLLHGATFLGSRPTVRCARGRGAAGDRAVVAGRDPRRGLCGLDARDSRMRGLWADVMLAVPVVAVGRRRRARAGRIRGPGIRRDGASRSAAWSPRCSPTSTRTSWCRPPTSANNLTVASTASGDYALKVMTIVAAVMLPIVLLYQGWSYYVFRARITAPAPSDAIH